MLGSLIVYLKGMRIMMFQLSGYYCRRVLEGYCSHKACIRASRTVLHEASNYGLT